MRFKVERDGGKETVAGGELVGGDSGIAVSESGVTNLSGAAVRRLTAPSAASSAPRFPTSVRRPRDAGASSSRRAPRGGGGYGEAVGGYSSCDRKVRAGTETGPRRHKTGAGGARERRERQISLRGLRAGFGLRVLCGLCVSFFRDGARRGGAGLFAMMNAGR